MKRKILRSLGLIVAAAVLVVSFQNCASEFDISSYTQESSSSGSSDTGGGDANPNPNPNPTPSPTPTPTPTPPTPPPSTAVPTEVTANEFSSCALKTDGTAYCWGYNVSGQLGDGTTTTRYMPVRVNTALKFKRISMGSPIANRTGILAGSQTACGVTLEGDVYCWGSNSNGQVGAGLPANSNPVLAPVKVQNIPTQVVDVKVGATFACARSAAGLMWCWGSNASGELGNGTNTQSITATQVQIANVADFDLAQSHSLVSQNRACAVTFDGQVHCWGNNYLANGTVGNSTTPQPVPGATNMLRISISTLSSCGISNAKTVLCWGYRPYLGTGNQQATYVVSPVSLPTLTNIEEIAVAYNSGCAIRNDGALFCWGYNQHFASSGQIPTGHLGQISTINVLSSPTLVGNVTGATRVDMSTEHTCVGLTNGALQCFGYNALGGLGNNSTNATHLPQTLLLP